MDRFSIPDIIRVTARNMGLTVTHSQVQQIAAKAERAKRRGADAVLAVLEVEISALERRTLERLIGQKRAELETLEQRLAGMP